MYQNMSFLRVLSFGRNIVYSLLKYFDIPSPGKQQDNFCSRCFNEVCSRCATIDDDVAQFQEVRIDDIPVCAELPSGATDSSKGTTVENLNLEKGYYRTSNQSHDILKCYQEKACHGGIDTAKYCASGYKGPCEKNTRKN